VKFLIKILGVIPLVAYMVFVMKVQPPADFIVLLFWWFGFWVFVGIKQAVDIYAEDEY
jgi:hypothetical protein